MSCVRRRRERISRFLSLSTRSDSNRVKVDECDDNDNPIHGLFPSGNRIIFWLDIPAECFAEINSRGRLLFNVPSSLSASIDDIIQGRFSADAPRYSPIYSDRVVYHATYYIRSSTSDTRVTANAPFQAGTRHSETRAICSHRRASAWNASEIDINGRTRWRYAEGGAVFQNVSKGTWRRDVGTWWRIRGRLARADDVLHSLPYEYVIGMSLDGFRHGGAGHAPTNLLSIFVCAACDPGCCGNLTLGHAPCTCDHFVARNSERNGRVSTSTGNKVWYR